MGKSRNQRDSRPAFRPYNKDSKSHKTRKNNQPSQPRPSSTQNSRVAPTIPFDFADRILLVGEGDFSFAHSLFTHHNCQNLVATCYDDVATLGAKYPQSTDYIRDLEDSTREDELTSIKIVYGVDATKMGKGGSAGGGKIIRKGGFDRIIFNFPHVGGLTKDVNRQVRHNQELLVHFFKAAIPLLASGGTIVVTIFEGEPYSLWNIRDLARHTGLKVGRSFKFQAEAYPGYKHARTLGNIEGGGGWKGEDRDARTYIFEKSDEGVTQAHSTRLVKRSDGSSDSDDD
ncbi:MAG: hypothetical protein L6R41_000739 [Letrouitia leprolyta]|nr:MAG: hypothetical protein L6R41_000739 [Letrouitia leprolyta]